MFSHEGKTLGFGCSSAVVPIQKIIDHFSVDEVIAAMKKLMSGRNLGLFSIITNYPEGDVYKKEVLLFRDENYLSDSVSRG